MRRSAMSWRTFHGLDPKYSAASRTRTSRRPGEAFFCLTERSDFARCMPSVSLSSIGGMIFNPRFIAHLSFLEAVSGTRKKAISICLEYVSEAFSLIFRMNAGFTQAAKGGFSRLLLASNRLPVKWPDQATVGDVP